MWRRSKPYLMVLPACAMLLLFFYGGMLSGFGESLGYSPIAGNQRLTFTHYKQLLGSAEFWQSLQLTLRISILSTLAGAILGVFLAVCLFMMGRTRIRLWGQRIFQIPLLVPHLVAAYLMVLLFMQSGWLSRFAYHMGLIQVWEQFPILINEPFGWGIIMTYAWKEAPFVGLMLLPVLQRIYGSWIDVARVLGAGRWHFFREVLLPLILPALISSTFIVFAFTFSAFELPYLLGVTYPKLLPVMSYQLYTSGNLLERQQALALNVILVLITTILSLLSYRISRHWIKRGGGW